MNLAGSGKLMLESYKVVVSKLAFDQPMKGIHKVSKFILTYFNGAMLDHFMPFSVKGDGNCFYRAVSNSIYGHE